MLPFLSLLAYSCKFFIGSIQDLTYSRKQDPNILYMGVF